MFISYKVKVTIVFTKDFLRIFIYGWSVLQLNEGEKSPGFLKYNFQNYHLNTSVIDLSGSSSRVSEKVLITIPSCFLRLFFT